MRKVYLDELPRKMGIGANKDKEVIDWKCSIGCTVLFEYDNITGSFIIVSYKLLNNCIVLLVVKYLDKLHELYKASLIKCQLAGMLGLMTPKYQYIYKYKSKEIITTNSGIIEIIKPIRIKHGNYTTNGYEYKCLIDNYVGEISESHLSQGGGCPVCCNKVVIKGFNDIGTTFPKVANLLLNKEDKYKYTKWSSCKVDFTCPYCQNIIKNKIISHVVRRGLSCPKCGDGISYPEKFVFNALLQLTNSFEVQKVFKWCKFKFNNKIYSGRYDFYLELNNKKYIIEVDGAFHITNNTMNGISKEEQKYIDDQKDALAKMHDIEVIRIKCYQSEFIEIKNNILSSKLSKLFDLNNIDWDTCQRHAVSTLVKKICDIWNITTHNISDISHITKLSKGTINVYLKKGANCGWCDYDPKLQLRNSGYKQGKLRSKKTICITLNHVFGSLTYAADYMKISKKNIFNCCHKKRETAGKLPDGTKLKWMYLDDYMEQNGYTDISQIPNVTIHNEPEIINT